MAPVKVTLKSDLPEFKNMPVIAKFEVEPDLTWEDFIKLNKVSGFDLTKHVIVTSHKKNIAKGSDRIENTSKMFGTSVSKGFQVKIINAADSPGSSKSVAQDRRGRSTGMNIASPISRIIQNSVRGRGRGRGSHGSARGRNSIQTKKPSDISALVVGSDSRIVGFPKRGGSRGRGRGSRGGRGGTRTSTPNERNGSDTIPNPISIPIPILREPPKIILPPLVNNSLPVASTSASTTSTSTAPGTFSRTPAKAIKTSKKPKTGRPSKSALPTSTSTGMSLAQGSQGATTISSSARTPSKHPPGFSKLSVGRSALQSPDVEVGPLRAVGIGFDATGFFNYNGQIQNSSASASNLELGLSGEVSGTTSKNAQKLKEKFLQYASRVPSTDYQLFVDEFQNLRDNSNPDEWWRWSRKAPRIVGFLGFTLSTK